MQFFQPGMFSGTRTVHGLKSVLHDVANAWIVTFFTNLLLFTKTYIASMCRLHQPSTIVFVGGYRSYFKKVDKTWRENLLNVQQKFGLCMASESVVGTSLWPVSFHVCCVMKPIQLNCGYQLCRYVESAGFLFIQCEKVVILA